MTEVIDALADRVARLSDAVDVFREAAGARIPADPEEAA
jgi:hypothetical protein